MQRNDDSGKYLVDACPNSEIFTDWTSIFSYIDGIRGTPESQKHIKNFCAIVAASVQMLTDRINDELTVLAHLAGYLAKVKELRKVLPRFLHRFETNDEIEIVGELLFLYKHINSDMYLEDTVNIRLPQNH